MMKFLDQPSRFLFFTGKGGVGKTSIACAAAMHLAEVGRTVLLVSTDPASNIGQVFGVDIGNHVVPITAVARLSALEIDPEAAAGVYRERLIAPVRSLLPDGVVKGIEESLSGACTTEIAAFDEFTTLLTDAALTSHFQHIVFDTAPTGHTIRLLQLPGAWSGFLETGRGDASCLGPLAGLAKQRAQYRAAVEALADPKRTCLVLVARAQQGALREVARTRQELAALGLSRQCLVINGVLPAAEAGEDALAFAIHRREQEALAMIPEALKDLPRDEIGLMPFNLVGLEALRGLLTTSSPRSADRLENSVERDLPSLATLVDDIAADGHGLILLMGKGGVGKTTLAAAIAVALVARGLPVHLTTSDPAAHLVHTLDGAPDGLTVSCIDPHTETDRYRRHVLETKGAELDAEGRVLLEEDLRSPCTEEIAVFRAFSRVIREAHKSFIVMDTAPTGHTLLLLDAAGAYHREVARQKGSADRHAATPMMQLRDPQQTKVLLVTLAETTPVLEAAQLQRDLLRAGITPWAWVINMSVAASSPRSPLLQERARHEWREIGAVASGHSARTAIIPLLKDEPIGRDRLLALCEAPDTAVSP